MSTTAPSAEAAAQLFFPPNVQYNNSRLYSVKFLSSCFAGAVAGVLGLENTVGFALFVISTLFTSACLYLKCKSRPAKYVPGGWWELVNPGQENMFSFVLLWTLFYGTSHLPFFAVTDLLEALALAHSPTPPHPMAASYALLQFSADPWNARFEDLENRLAFTVTMADENPNLIMKIAREAPWAQQHPDIMGPSNSYLYFGPNRTPGHLIYGNSTYHTMAQARHRKKDSSTSRYFWAQNGKEYKWRIATQRLECVDSKGNVIAVWETSQLADPFAAKLTFKHAALPIITEIVTTLTLNRIAQVSNWQ
ncbi:hypothetical protein C8Q79DRAFT_1007112 [Trametes meyenii]|nr:hypothetical protein C8Q79DRAFT_1007112 [Trametes meyenii]